MVSESAAPLLSVRSSFDIESGPAKGGASDGGESHEKTVGFGKKTIGWFGSMCLLYGNITGPGMVQIPGLFQSAGWVVPTLLFFIFSWLAGVVSLYLAKAISLLPGNRRFGERIEFNEIARAAFPYWAYLATMVLISECAAAPAAAAVAFVAAAAATSAAAAAPPMLPPPPFFILRLRRSLQLDGVQHFRRRGERADDGCDAARCRRANLRHLPLPAARPGLHLARGRAERAEQRLWRRLCHKLGLGRRSDRHHPARPLEPRRQHLHAGRRLRAAFGDHRRLERAVHLLLGPLAGAHARL